MLIKVPCWPDCPDETENKTCRASCEKWENYEAAKFKEYEEKQKKCRQNISYMQYLEEAVTRMRRGKKKL